MDRIEHELQLKNLIVVKRDGSEEKFQAEKIETAIEKAFESAKEKLDPYVAKNVLWDIKLTEFKDNKIDIEWIQDNIEENLSTHHYAVMKKFMLYRYLHKLQREKVMKQGTTYIDCNETIDEYVSKEDWRINANSNTGYSHAGLINNTAGKVIANYWLDKVLTKKQGRLHRDGFIHVHDLDYLTPYCGGWSLRALLDEGFNGLRGGVDARPPKHIMEALNQMVNFLSCLSLEWSGAQAFSSFDTYLAPYLFRDKITDEELYRYMRSFVYNLNVPSKWGQCVPEDHECLRADGKWVTYQELKKGDVIYVYDMKDKKIKTDKVMEVNVFEAPEILHRYGNKHGFEFFVTDKHRVVYKTGHNKTRIEESKDLIGRNIQIPVSAEFEESKEIYKIEDDFLELIVFILTDGAILENGCLEFHKTERRWGIERFEELCKKYKITYIKRLRENKAWKSEIWGYKLHVSENTKKIVELLNGTKKKIPEWMYKLTNKQYEMLINTWSRLDGHRTDSERFKLQADTEDIQDFLMYAVMKTGRAARKKERNITRNQVPTKYVNVYSRGFRDCTPYEVKNTRYKKVWCPTTNTGTFICRNSSKGVSFITGNSPFSNLTLDLTVPEDLKDQIPTREQQHLFKDIKDDELLAECRKRGKEKLIDMTYGDFLPEMERVTLAYYKVLTEGDAKGRPFTFPIPTVNITEDFDWNSKVADALFENAARRGSTYFQNFIGSQYVKDEKGNLVPNEKAYKPGHIRSMCCRLQLDLRELLKRGGGLFGSAEMTGGISNTTINLARLGYLHKGDKEAFYKHLDDILEEAKDISERRRRAVTDLYNRGLYKYTKRYLPNFNHHFSIIGINGGNEMIRNFTNDKEDITTEVGVKIAYEVTEHIRNKIKTFQEETGNLYNLEASPAESATTRFAREDKKRFPDIIQAGFGWKVYYTNSTQVPVNYSDDMFEVLDLQDDLQCQYTGGTVLHLYMDNPLPDKDAAREIIRKVVTNYKLPYVTITPTIRVCEKHGEVLEAADGGYCPYCDRELLEKHADELSEDDREALNLTTGEQKK